MSNDSTANDLDTIARSSPPAGEVEKKAITPEEISIQSPEAPRYGWLSSFKTRLGLSTTNSAVPVTLAEDGQPRGRFSEVWRVLWKFARFMGPGALISVAYIDPDNYQTNLQAGQDFQYELLFMILVANVIAIYLQVCTLLASSHEEDQGIARHFTHLLLAVSCS
jgi:hypothetical protein